MDEAERVDFVETEEELGEPEEALLLVMRLRF
jgi:hypothetical protein